MSSALAYQTTSNLEKHSSQLDMLIKACTYNDRVAQKEIYYMFYPKMMAMIRRYFEDEMMAEEIINNGFLRVFSKIHLFEFKGSFEGWVRRIMHNAVADYARNNLKFHQHTVLDDKEYQIEKKESNNLFYQDLLKIIETLPQTTKVVFNMFVLDGLPHKEIAKMLNISENTSKWHVCEAKKQLKVKIETLNLHK